MPVQKILVIGSQSYPSYADLTDALNYFQSRPGAEDWVASSDTAKQTKDLVAASRYADSIRWQGTRVSAKPALAWPRSGVVDIDNNPVSAGSIPQDVVYGVLELAYSLWTDPSALLSTPLGTASNIKRVKAGPAEVDYFRPQGGTRIPTEAWDILKIYITGPLSTSAAAPESFGQTNPDGSAVTSSFDGSNINNDFGLIRQE